ncbi:tyrosine-protein kinase Btk29A-like [Pollicipes pollicipes]|uniref:tyrosine-protein kinase Btk29A-like n=1 Tax=Pollicipes pollicipes TaxID=41117 RepID=UPI0018852F5C|nr:tyrosine-protein kinase Btk29A-like [Pollicipes pollicipes]XP_037087377.1 tyrosine-protein kinase Btk29A-like [Pollicipes pollicipes]XP_037087378.1 tyrosine-protein kinase Btk29A-like [Pollicipes pollicipes]XP_037087379.1 tyrosine-protein kinase Btk29A-like [Pollicipes pollicipes]
MGFLEQSSNKPSGPIIKESYMVKRSQNKKRFGPVNYKNRWFVLTPTALAYHDGGPERKGREKGRIELASVRVVEPLSENALDSRPHSFQLGYGEYTLYVSAGSDDERDDWLMAIRELCRGNGGLLERYHPHIWQNGRWQCCGHINKGTAGCEETTHMGIADPELPVSQSEPLFDGSTAVGGVAAPGGLAAPFTGQTLTQPPPLTDGAAPTPAKPKIVVALYSYHAIEDGDLSLTKGSEYEVVEDSREHWWQARNAAGQVGYIPSNYVQEKEQIGLQQYDWYVVDMSRQRSESMLKDEAREGCFVVRNSSSKGMYTLSLFTSKGLPRAQVKHYHIKQTARGECFLSEKHTCANIPELIHYHQHNSGGLATRLKQPPLAAVRSAPATAGLSHDKWEIEPLELTLLEELGSGTFGVVRHGKWRGSIDVAVKMMKEGTMSEDDFIEEAKVMTKLQHQNLVQLYGVCSKHRPIFIVTEYMKFGSLHSYLRKNEATLIASIELLLHMCLQVSKGMAYLERHNYIHRDLAARNCLVGSEMNVKVADFGLARYVLDDQYTSSGGAKFPIKWASPEVLNYTRFSSKSDVWAFGVLMWEVFTCGKMPYSRMKNAEVVERVQLGHVLDRPKYCAKDVYEVMQKCWRYKSEDRPTFWEIREMLRTIYQSVVAD